MSKFANLSKKFLAKFA